MNEIEKNEINGNNKETEKKPAVWKAFLYLLIIPVQLLINVFIFRYAYSLDMGMVDTDTEKIGHPVPVFTGFSVLIIIALTGIMIILAILLTVNSFIKRRKKLKMWECEHYYEEHSGPACQ